jgi:outer membrane lipoprotein-sorting protein
VGNEKPSTAVEDEDCPQVLEDLKGLSRLIHLDKEIYMKKSLVLMFLLTLGLSAAPLSADVESADPILMLQQIETILRGNSHSMTAAMKIKTTSWTRDYKFMIWMEGADKTFARVTEPAKVEGQGYLRLQARLWNYIPTAERTILIPPSMMLDRFMGSDFSNDDFVKMSYLPRDYTPSIMGRELLEGVEMFRLELKPKKDAPVTYSKLIVILRAEDFMPVRIEFFNEKLEHIRTLEYSEVRDIGGHPLPSVWTMKDHREKGRVTTVTVEEAQFNAPIPAAIFSQQNLEKYP